MSNIIDSIQLSGVTYAIQGSGGKAIEAGRGISITTGETADTVSFNLPISAGTGSNSVIEGSMYNFASGNYSHAEGSSTIASGHYSHAEGNNTRASGNYSHVEGGQTEARGNYSHAEGFGTIANNQSEHASGLFNNSVSASTTFGDSGNTLFSVGNGTTINARHNAFEIRQNGDIYLSSGGTDIKLQDHLGGGGGIPESAFTAYTAATDSRIAEDEEVTAAGLNALNSAISGISGNNVVELTQAEYDALVSGGTVDPTAFYIITDATPVDMSQYWTSAQTQSAITQATSGKVDTSTYNTYTAATDTALANKADTATTYTKTEVDTALASKQTTLTAGTGIDITDNVISATGGGGGGKAVSGGTNISITTGETADTINCTLPYYIDSGGCWTIYGDSSSIYSNNSTGASDSVYIGSKNEIKNTNTSSTRKTTHNILIGWKNKLDSYCTYNGMGFNVIIGNENTLSRSNNIRESFVIGSYNIGNTSYEFICGRSNEARNLYETSFGTYNNSVSGSSTFGDSGNTLFSVGNGTVGARHNAFEIRQNGDIYLSLNGQDVKLQDQLGGGTVDQTIISGSTNAVAGGAVYSKIDEVEQVTAAALNDLNDTIGNINTILESI